MIRIIRRLRARSLDLGDGERRVLPMVPATGQLEVSDTVTDAGRIATARLSATLSADHDLIRDNLILDVDLCDGPDGETVTLGTEDLPVRLDVSVSDTVRISCAWQYPVR